MKPKQVKQILLSEIKFDEKINLQLTRKQTKETKELFKRKNYYKFVSSTTSSEIKEK